MKKWIFPLKIAVFSAITTTFVLHWLSNSKETTSVETTTFESANTQPVSLRLPETSTDFTIAAEKTIHAVVHVKNVSSAKGPQSLMDFFYGYESFSAPQIGTGSGVIVSPDGYIVTNNHVIEETSELEVTLNNNASYTAKIIGTDPNSDLALLKIETEEELPYLAFGDSDRSAVGEWVLAVGNPFNLTSTVTAGIISAKSRSISTTNNLSFIQTDAAVNPGNSGGALVNTKGELIGINTAIKSRTGSYVGYSFAIPSNTAKKVIEDLLEFGKVQRGILGISALRAESIEAIRKGLNEIEGVYISEVNAGSGAEVAGLQSGDIIKRVDGLPIKNFTALTGYLSAKRPGDQVEIIFERDEKQLSTVVTLTKNETADLNRLGLRVQNLNETLRKKFNRNEGVIITAASEYYKNYNLEGKVVIAIDGVKISTIEDAIEASNENSTYRHAITVIDEEGNKETLIFN